jgi:hypothetical protein
MPRHLGASIWNFLLPGILAELLGEGFCDPDPEAWDPDEHAEIISKLITWVQLFAQQHELIISRKLIDASPLSISEKFQVIRLLESWGITVVDAVSPESIELQLEHLSGVAIAQRDLEEELENELERLPVLLYLLSQHRILFSGDAVRMLMALILTLILILVITLDDAETQQDSGAGVAPSTDDPIEDEATGSNTGESSESDTEDTSTGSQQKSNSVVPSQRQQSRQNRVTGNLIANLIFSGVISGTSETQTLPDLLKPMMLLFGVLGLKYYLSHNMPQRVPYSISDEGVKRFINKLLGRDAESPSEQPHIVIEWPATLPELVPILPATVIAEKVVPQINLPNLLEVLLTNSVINRSIAQSSNPSQNPTSIGANRPLPQPISFLPIDQVNLPALMNPPSLLDDSSTVDDPAENHSLTVRDQPIVVNRSATINRSTVNEPPVIYLPTVTKLALGVDNSPLQMIKQAQFSLPIEQVGLSVVANDNRPLAQPISFLPIDQVNLLPIVSFPSAVENPATVNNPLIIVNHQPQLFPVIEMINLPVGDDLPTVVNNVNPPATINPLSIDNPVVDNPPIVSDAVSGVDRPTRINLPTVLNNSLVVIDPPITSNLPIVVDNPTTVGSPIFSSNLINIVNSPPFVHNSPVVVDSSIIHTPSIANNPATINNPVTISNPTTINNPATINNPDSENPLPTIADNQPLPKPQPFPTIDSPPPSVTKPDFNEGVFVVDDSGKITIDFLYDNGFYEGELAIVNLTGMEQFVGNSTAFIQEVLRRASSQSDLGYIVISDRTEGAKYGTWDPANDDFNTGSYLGVKTFQMKPGTQVGLVLIPNSTVKEVSNRTNLADDQRPIFSFGTNGSTLFGQAQFANVTPSNSQKKYIVVEDIAGSSSDQDYNDLVIRVGGVASNTIPSAATRLNLLNPPLGLSPSNWCTNLQSDFDRYQSTRNL